MGQLTQIDSYLTLKKESSSIIKINKSKFIAQAFIANAAEETNRLIAGVKKKFFDASHHPFAWRIGLDGNLFRFYDDGEPSGSSGKPILEAIDKFKLTNLIVIVTRYFGGVKLGAGNLRRAYFDAACACLENAGITEKIICETLKLEFDYNIINTVLSYLGKNKIKVTEIKSKNDNVNNASLTIEVRISLIDTVKKDLLSLTAGKIKIL